MSSGFFDSEGNEAHVGAIARMYHFTSWKRKEYMYKQIGEFDSVRNKLKIHHLPFKPDHFYYENRECFAEDYIIVQDYLTVKLKRSKKLRD